MRYLKQLHRHDPENGSVGDCYRTCLACLLDKDVEDVPHLNEIVPVEEFNALYTKYLDERGLQTITVGYSGSLADVLLTVNNFNPGAYYLLTGHSKAGDWNHVVVGHNDQIIWDPSQSYGDGEHGIVGPAVPDGFYWVEFIVRKL